MKDTTNNVPPATHESYVVLDNSLRATFMSMTYFNENKSTILNNYVSIFILCHFKKMLLDLSVVTHILDMIKYNYTSTTFPISKSPFQTTILALKGTSSIKK